MKNLISVLLTMVFMSHSTVTLAQASKIDEMGESNREILIKLNRELNKELNSKKKTDLKKVHISKRKEISTQFNKLAETIIKESPQNEVNQKLDDLTQLQVSTLQTLDEQVSKVDNYADFLKELILEISTSIDTQGNYIGNNAQSVILIVILIVAGIVIGSVGTIITLRALIMDWFRKNF